MEADAWKRFLKNTVADGECLIWKGPGFGEQGFGLWKETRELAHRAAYAHHQGKPARTKHLVLQTCGRKRCVAKVHLKEDPNPSRP